VGWNVVITDDYGGTVGETCESLPFLEANPEFPDGDVGRPRSGLCDVTLAAYIGTSGEINDTKPNPALGWKEPCARSHPTRSAGVAL